MGLRLAGLSHKLTQEIFASRDLCDMVKGGGFRAHGEDKGARLREQLELGESNWARRFAPIEVVGVSVERPDRGLVLRPRAVRVDLARAAETASRLKVMKGRGRPRVEGARPWDVEGVSRRTWERRKKGGVV